MKPSVKDYMYYSDLYDRGTVAEARILDKLDKDQIKKNLEKFKEESKKKEYLRVTFVATNLIVYFYTGERYTDKKKTIDEWIERDKKELEFYESINKPKDGSYCSECHTEMNIITKDIRVGIDNKPDRILFMLECKNCQVRKGVYDNGEEWISSNEYCKKCEGLNDRQHERKGDVITTYIICTVCGHKEKDVLKLNEPIHKEKPDPYYARDRKKYCLSEEEGQKYIQGKAQMESLDNLMKEIKERENNKEVYDRVAKLKKLKVAELKDLVSKELNKQKYTNLQFETPQMERYVTIGFTVEDAKSDREDYDSRKQLKILINKTLKDTNWRLMSDGISYRLGVLSGRLKGYEGEEELLKLFK